MQLFNNIYAGRRVLVTGHTGFKGSWLTCWLNELGAEITGVALDPESTPSHYNLIAPAHSDHRVDIRDAKVLNAIIAAARPEIVLHLAAQPLVRRSYRDPLETWSTNVIGTANLLNACRDTRTIRSIVVVTTDKVYANKEWAWGYREIDELGGHDPYSASKAATEIAVASYRKAFFRDPGSPLVATARAGNVVGGGDWSEDRLIPDLVRAVKAGNPLEIRSPESTRPWQHVLETLAGYLQLGQLLFEGETSSADAWNFGPEPADNRSVRDILKRLSQFWPELTWHVSARPQVHEANLLYLDSAKAARHLGWRPVWRLDEALKSTADWYRAHDSTGHASTVQQIKAYVEDARRAQPDWLKP